MSNYLIWCTEKFITEEFGKEHLQDEQLWNFVTECIMSGHINLDDSYSCENYMKEMEAA